MLSHHRIWANQPRVEKLAPDEERQWQKEGADWKTSWGGGGGSVPDLQTESCFQHRLFQ